MLSWREPFMWHKEPTNLQRNIVDPLAYIVTSHLLDADWFFCCSRSFALVVLRGRNPPGWSTLLLRYIIHTVHITVQGEDARSLGTSLQRHTKFIKGRCHYRLTWQRGSPLQKEPTIKLTNISGWDTAESSLPRRYNAPYFPKSLLILCVHSYFTIPRGARQTREPCPLARLQRDVCGGNLRRNDCEPPPPQTRQHLYSSQARSPQVQ